MLNYLAGFFDGEGCANVTERRNYKDSIYTTLTMVVSQNDRAACQLFKDVLGVGNVYRTRPGHHQWRANGEEARQAAKQLRPYLKLAEKIADVDKLIATDSAPRKG